MNNINNMFFLVYSIIYTFIRSTNSKVAAKDICVSTFALKGEIA